MLAHLFDTLGSGRLLSVGKLVAAMQGAKHEMEHMSRGSSQAQELVLTTNEAGN